MKYLFDHWCEVEGRVRGKRIVLLLDFDGTLTNIAGRPADAKLIERAREILIRLGKSCFVALVSGRQIDDLKAKVAIDGITYTGSHGLELTGPGMAYTHEIRAEALEAFDVIRAKLREMGSIEGMVVEDKGNCISIHYRLCSESEQERIKREIGAAAQRYVRAGAIGFGEGKKVLELPGDPNWNKGSIVEWILERVGDGGRREAIYVGDDVTDEDAFAVLGEDGITVRVGESGESRAQYFVHSPDEVTRLLEYIERIAGGQA